MTKAMPTEIYRDLKNRVFVLDDFDPEERELIVEFQQFAKSSPDWGDYTNAWMPRAESLLSQRGLTRREMVASELWRVLQDIGARLHIASGLSEAPDYRDELAELIRTRFHTRREFCQLTGLSEDLLSHVLARRKHFAIDTLADALAKIGYGIHLLPQATAESF